MEEMERERRTLPALIGGGAPRGVHKVGIAVADATAEHRSDRPDQGRAILQAGLYAQFRSRPTMHHSTPHFEPMMPVSSPMR